VRVGDSQRAVVDYKGRLLYTSAAPQVWDTDMTPLPAIKRALDAGKGDSVTVLPYRDPALVTTHVLGNTAPKGLVMMFLRTLALGDKASEQSEARAIYVQLLDGNALLKELRLDDETVLGLVAPDGVSMIGDEGLSATLVAAALRSGEVANVTDRGHAYQVQARVVPGLEGQGEVARVVMARELDGTLTLFPHARFVFAVTALASLALAIATALRARQISGARV
jgi:hypothetical protein